MLSNVIQTAFSSYPKDMKHIRSHCNIALFQQIILGGYNLNKLLLELGISKNYYQNYCNGYSVLSMLQFKQICDFILNYEKGEDEVISCNKALLLDSIYYWWILSKVYETK